MVFLIARDLAAFGVAVNGRWLLERGYLPTNGHGPAL